MDPRLKVLVQDGPRSHEAPRGVQGLPRDPAEKRFNTGLVARGGRFIHPPPFAFQCTVSQRFKIFIVNIFVLRGGFKSYVPTGGVSFSQKRGR